MDGDNALKEQADQTGIYGSLSVNHSTGVWTYTLDNSAGGATDMLDGTEDPKNTDAFTMIMAADGTEAMVTITITGANDAATFSGTQTGAVTEDATVNTATGSITVSDVDGDNALKEQADQTGIYGSLSVNHSTGVWTYTLDNSAGGATDLLDGTEDPKNTDAFTIMAADGTEAMVTITITGANDAATFSGTQTGAVTEDATSNTATGTITVSDVDGDNALKEQADQTGIYGSLSVNHSTGVWTYTLDNSAGGATDLLDGTEDPKKTDVFTIMAADRTEAMVTITITGVKDDATIGGMTTGNIIEGTATTTGTVTATDGDGANTFKTGVLPATGAYGSLTITSAGVWTYTLDNSAGGATDLLNGTEDPKKTDVFTIMAADGASGTITITIMGVNDAATFSGTQTGAVTEDATVNTATGSITVSDVDGDNALKEQVDQTGIYGSLSVNHSTGAWTYTLDNSAGGAADMLDGTEDPKKTDAFTIMAEDGTEATVTITVTGVNDDATIGGMTTGTITEGAATTAGTVTATDGDGANTFKTEVSPTTGTYGSLTITTAGAWTYTLDNSAGGATDLLNGTEDPKKTDVFTIMAADGTSGTVAITITGVNDDSSIAVTGSPGFVTEDDTANAVVLGTFTLTDPDSDPLPTITSETRVGTYGWLTIAMKTRDTNDGEYTWTYELDNSPGDATGNATNALAAGAMILDEFMITASDGTKAAVTIMITGSADVGVIEGNLAGSVTEDDPAKATASGRVMVTRVSGVTFTTKTDGEGTYGDFMITNDGDFGVWTYTLDNSPGDDQGNATNALKDGDEAIEIFDIVASNGAEAMVTITVIGADETNSVPDPILEPVEKYLRGRTFKLLSDQPRLIRFLKDPYFCGCTANEHLKLEAAEGSLVGFEGSFERNGIWGEISVARSRQSSNHIDYLLGVYGIHGPVSETALAGLMFQFDKFNQADESLGTGQATIDGQGWLIGPYFAARHKTQPLYFEGRLLYGVTRNNILFSDSSDIGLRRGTFDTQRWLASFRVEGEILLDYGDIRLIPHLGCGLG